MESATLLTGFVSLSEYATEMEVNLRSDLMERTSLADSFDSEPTDQYNFKIVINNPLVDSSPKRPGIRNCAGKSNCTKCGLCGMRRKF